MSKNAEQTTNDSGHSQKTHQIEFNSVDRKYISLIDTLSEKNKKNKAWWYCWASSRDVHNIRFCEFLENNENEDTFSLLNRITPKRFNLNFKFSKRLNYKFHFLCNVLFNILSELRLLLRAISVSEKPILNNQLDDLFVSVVNERTSKKNENRDFRDDYFGELPGYLLKKGRSVLVCSMHHGDVVRISKSVQKSTGVQAVLLYAFLRKRDVFASLWWVLSSRIEWNVRGQSFEIPYAKQFMIDEYWRTIRYVLRARLLEVALKKVLDQTEVQNLYSIYENNPWERAVNFAIRSAPQTREIRNLGYMHNPIIPNNLLIAADPGEVVFRPDPELIAVTGEEARRALLAFESYKIDKVVPGCALRQSVTKPSACKTVNKIGSLLVLLSGMDSMIGLIKYLIEQSERMDNVTIVLRPHPNRSVEDLAKKAGIQFRETVNLKISRQIDLESDLDETDGVIYCSSGAMFAAAYRGLPLFYFKNNNSSNSDPLFMREELRFPLNKSTDLKKTILEYDRQSLQLKAEKTRKLCQFAQEYMVPPTTENIEKFIKILN
jgi:hypothetical protein